MKREVTATGATVEEAILNARNELGIDDSVVVDTEIIDTPEKKFLGLFGGKPAKVSLSYDDGKKDKKANVKPRGEKRTAPKAASNSAPKTAPKSDKVQNTASNKAAKTAQKPVEKAEKSEPKAKTSTPKPARSKTVDIKPELVKKTVDFVTDILSHMNVGEFSAETSEVEGGFCISLSGDGLGSIIGRRGETLDALQYLASLCYNNDEDGFVRVVLDTNNYRAKRAETLTNLAQKVADQALSSGHNQSLEPMNPYERRIIHTAVQEMDGVTSWSVSDGRNRRVIIGAANEDGTPVNPAERPMRSRSGGRRRSGGYGRSNSRGGRGDRRDSRRDSQTINAQPTREKKSDASDLPLFGRINK